MGAAESSAAPHQHASEQLDSNEVVHGPPSASALREAIGVLTDTVGSSHDAKMAAAAVRRLEQSRAAPSRPSRPKPRRRRTADPRPLAPQQFSDHTPSVPPPAAPQPAPKLSLGVGGCDLQKLLASPAPTLRLDPIAGVLSDGYVAAIGDCLGLYKLVSGLSIRGRPVWRHVTGRDRWLGYGHRGWLVQSERALQRLSSLAPPTEDALPPASGAAASAAQLAEAGVEVWLELRDEIGMPPDCQRETEVESRPKRRGGATRPGAADGRWDVCYYTSVPRYSPAGRTFCAISPPNSSLKYPGPVPRAPWGSFRTPAPSTSAEHLQFYSQSPEAKWRLRNSYEHPYVRREHALLGVLGQGAPFVTF